LPKTLLGVLKLHLFDTPPNLHLRRQELVPVLMLKALVCAVLLIVYDLVAVTTSWDINRDAFFGPKTLSRKSSGWTLTSSTLLKKQRCGLRQRTPQIRQRSRENAWPKIMLQSLGSVAVGEE
jgi:hypothetical protein